MNRDAAIEAGARALRAVSARLLGDPSWDYLDEPLRGMYRKRAAAVIDAAAPHLTPEPVAWAVMFDEPNWEDGVVYRRWDSLERDYPGSIPGVRRCALVPVEDQP